MHPAAPSAAEASRGRPAVKTGEPTADDDLVTSVAYVPEDGSEPVSPELALIDPTLAERLRADLSEPALEAKPVARPVEPAPEAEPVPEAVVHEHEPVEVEPVAVDDVAAEEPPSPDPEPDAPVAEAPEPPSASVHVLRPAPALAEPELPAPEAAEPEPAPAVPVELEPRPVPHLELAAEPVPEIVPPEPEPEPEPEAVRTPEPEVVAVPAATPTVPVARLPVIPTPPAGASHRPASVSPLRRRSRIWQLLVLLATIVLFAGIVTVGVVAVSELRGGPSSPTVGAPQSGGGTEPGGSAASASRRFAWAPVAGAVSYRFELFRGDVQVLSATTPEPVYELPTSWQHEGREERLTSGSYQWYVWPVLASGQADTAVVQAQLDVP